MTTVNIIVNIGIARDERDNERTELSFGSMSTIWVGACHLV